MKVSVSIPDEDIAFLDEYMQRLHVPSRSAALQRAIRLLRASELGTDYAAAFEEWHLQADSQAWDRATVEGASKPT